MPPNITSRTTTETVGIVTEEAVVIDSSNQLPNELTNGLKHRTTNAYNIDNNINNSNQSTTTDNLDYSNIADDTKDIKIYNNNYDNSNNNPNIISNLTKTNINGATITTEFTPQIRWPDLIVQMFIHFGFLYGLYYLITFNAKFYTYIWCKYYLLFY